MCHWRKPGSDPGTGRVIGGEALGRTSCGLQLNIRRNVGRIQVEALCTPLTVIDRDRRSHSVEGGPHQSLGITRGSKPRLARRASRDHKAGSREADRRDSLRSRLQAFRFPVDHSQIHRGLPVILFRSGTDKSSSPPRVNELRAKFVLVAESDRAPGAAEIRGKNQAQFGIFGHSQQETGKSVSCIDVTRQTCQPRAKPVKRIGILRPKGVDLRSGQLHGGGQRVAPALG